MSGFPNSAKARIDRRKIVEYLLSRSHPVGRGKATFFETLGFAASDPDLFETALRELLQQPESVEAEDTGFGSKYIVDGILRGPAGQAFVRTIWIFDRGSDFARFVTAYPMG